MNRWKVVKREGEWRLLDRGVWFDSFDTLEEAHTYATQSAVADEIYEDGGLTRLKALVEAVRIKDFLDDPVRYCLQCGVPHREFQTCGRRR